MGFKKLLLILTFGAIVIYLIKSLIGSPIFFKVNRINIVIYDVRPTFISLGLNDKINYIGQFTPDTRVMMPGGYGPYRMGAVGRLISLEKKPDIFKKTFSYNVGTFVDYYFYPDHIPVYYSSQTKSENLLPMVKTYFLYQSNANLLERIYIIWRIYGRKDHDFINLMPESFITRGQGQYFNIDQFHNRYLGYFYDKTYREEKKNVQIIYKNSYRTALAISQIIEGNGIHIADIDQKESDKKDCQVVEKSKTFSDSARRLSNFFHCRLTNGDVGIFDIILSIGSLEKDWEIQSMQN